MKITTLFLVTFTFLLLSCGQGQIKKQDRGPASVSAPKLWGEPVTPESQDIIDEIENAPSRKYQGKYTEASN